MPPRRLKHRRLPWYDHFPEAIRIIADPPRLIVVLLTSAFGGRDEAQRHADVLECLYRQLTTDERPLLQFVFDDTPPKAGD